MKKPKRWQVVTGVAVVLAVATGGALAATRALNHHKSTSTGAVAVQSAAPVGVTPTFGATVAATPRPETAGIKAGDTPTTNPGVLAGGLMTYPMPDGTYLVVDPAKELPGKVLAAVTNDGTAALGGNMGAPAGDAARTAAFTAFSDYTHATTGRWVVMVARTAPTDTTWSFWGRDGGATHQSTPATLEQATAQAHTWADGQPSGSQILVLVAVGA